MTVTPNPHKVRIIQHNCNRSTTAMHSCLKSAENTADIVIIQEPWIGTNESPPSYYTISHPSFTLLLSQPDHCPRTATYITRTNPHINANLRTDLCNDEDIQILSISTPSIDTLFLFNIYNKKPRYDQTQPYTVDRILKNINIPTRTILAGNFNAHHPWWNYSTKRPIRHETLIQISEAGNFDLLNEEDTPTYHYAHGSSVLDLTFSSPPITPLISNWAIDEDNPTSSDHELIRFDISSTENTILDVPTNERWNWKKADWENFGKNLKERSDSTSDIWQALHLHNNQANLNSAAKFLTPLIHEAAETCIPKRKPSPRSKPWWNDDINKKRTLMKSRLRQWKAERTTPNWNQYATTRNLYQRTIRDAKTNLWNDFHKNARGKDIFTALKYTKPRRTEPTPDITLNGHTATTFQRKAQLFRQALFPPHQ